MSTVIRRSSSASVTVGVALIASTVTLDQPITPVYGSTTTLDATASVPGTVTFFDGSTAICSHAATSLLGPYVATCTWAPSETGATRLTAVLTPTNSNVTESTSVSVSVGIGLEASTVTLEQPPTPVYGSTTTLDATASVPGTVTFFDGSTEICTGAATTTISPYVASCIWTPSETGGVTLRASFVPTSTGMLPSTSASLGLTVGLEESSTSLTQPTGLSYGSATTLDATASAPGSMTFFDGSTALCSDVATSTSSPYDATCSWMPSLAGNVSLSTSFVPTSVDLGPSTSATLQLSVQQARSIITAPTVLGMVNSPTSINATTNVAGEVRMILVGVGQICLVPTTGLAARCSWIPSVGGAFNATIIFTPSNPNYSSTQTSLLVFVQGLPTSVQLSGPSTATYDDPTSFTAVSSVPGTISFEAGGYGYLCASVATTLTAPYTATCDWTPPNGTDLVNVVASLTPTNPVYAFTSSNSVAVQLTYSVTINDTGRDTIVSAVATYTDTSNVSSSVDGVISGAQVTFEGLGAGTLLISIEVEPPVCFYFGPISGSIGSIPFVASGAPADQVVSTAEPIAIDTTTADPNASNDFSLAYFFNVDCA